MNRVCKILLSGGVAVTMAGGLAACSSPSASPSNKSVVSAKNGQRQQNLSDGAAPSLKAADQASSGYSVKVESVTWTSRPVGTEVAANSANVGLALDANGTPGPILCGTTVKPGTTRNLMIHCTSRLDPGKYFVVLYLGASQSGDEPSSSLAKAIINISSPS